MASDIYSQVLGKDWWALAENIRLAHAVDQEARGGFCISHGTGWLARQLARWLHLPKAAKLADTSLKITTEGTGERWERQFDGEAFTTRQWIGKGGHLVERLGGCELYFKLRVEDGKLFYEQHAAKLCLGALSIPLPLTCAPHVSATEISDGRKSVLVSVTVTLPLVGLLIAYEGYLNVKGTSS